MRARDERANYSAEKLLPDAVDDDVDEPGAQRAVLLGVVRLLVFHLLSFNQR
jgi:hypothetical protein